MNGDDVVWVPDRSWRVLKGSHGRRCRADAGPGRPACGKPAVATLARRAYVRHQNVVRWWAYCADHLYGRKLQGDAVLLAVASDSPAAERGYVE